MKEIILKEPGRLLLADAPAPAGPGPDEALVRARRVGLCGTDYHAFCGEQPFFTYPRVLGHELAVEIIECGPNSYNLRAGDLCAVEPYLECGRCIACARARPNCCVDLKVMGVHVDGGLREVYRVPLRKLHRSLSLSADELALVEPFAIGAHAVERARLEKGETALVVGVGPIGLSIVQAAQAAGARVIAMDLNEERLKFCEEHFGAAHVINTAGDAEESLRQLTHGEMPTAVFEATGSASSMERAFRFVASGGRLILVGLCQANLSFHDPEFHRREMTVMSSRNSTSANFTEIISLMETGKLDPGPWVTHRIPFLELPGRFPALLGPESGVLKALVEW
jgi:2-desacetyl-2-hydroxyethyl bacteriochlorophyllide A dehydrogenase